MPAPFKKITVEQFAELLAKFPFKRKINAVHMHHTWRPNHAQYRGHDSIVAMWRYHTQHNGWSDIAQHLTIAPDGAIWLGRDWNRSPASAAGHNGNAQAGPFMFEMIGDFDDGKDPFDGEQRDAAYEVIARVQHRFGLAPGTLQLHNMMSSKTCPGSAIDYQTTLSEVTQRQKQIIAKPRGAARPGGAPQPGQIIVRDVIEESIESLQRATASSFDPFDAEPCLHGDGHAEVQETRGGGDAARGLGYTAIRALRPHIVNLRMGLFSSSGEWTTTMRDVDEIFDTHLPAALEAARARKRPLKLMLYAHGGLNSEEGALARTAELVKWWTANDIYPIHFVWETGLVETLGQMLERAGRSRDPAARNFFSDHVSDPVVEAFVHRAGGVQIWNAMKWSAEQASSPDALGGAARPNGLTPGGAWYVAEKLAALCQAHQDIEVHACGHSAGSIFHAWFIPCALQQGVPKFDSLHLMAPAVRVDLFRRQLEGHIGADKRIKTMTMYTMEDRCEKDDDCGRVYRKSLLYLIHHGLEPERYEPILGLERSVLADAGLRKLFGLDGAPGAAHAIWSDNELDRGDSASRSRTHGGFDDDPATMGSVALRVLGKPDTGAIVELPRSRQAANPWRTPADAWADTLAEHGFELPDFALPDPPPAVNQSPFTGLYPAQPAAQHPWPPSPAAGGGGRRTALCVGIDDYPSAPLAGCVNDARAWAGALERLGFETPQLLLDHQATRVAIMRHLTALVEQSEAGDVIVFQFAGHGTQVPDLDGDERGGDTPGEDEAMCPHDYMSGELLIDDDIRAIFGRLPEAVNLTCFFDCCHSGTITRFAFGRPGVARPAGTRARFIAADRRLIENFASRRRATMTRGAAMEGLDAMRDVVFSACLSSELALESQGHGDFTRHALHVLGQGTAGISNAAFADRITQAFGPSPRQHAKLYGSDAMRAAALLQPIGPSARAVPFGGHALATLLTARERADAARPMKV